MQLITFQTKKKNNNKLKISYMSPLLDFFYLFLIILTQ